MEDNTLIPSYFTVENRGRVSPDTNLNSVALRVGEVKDIVYPGDKLSLSKKWVEYTVEVIQRDGSSTNSSTLYHGCVVSQLFGGFADQMHYTLRKDEQKQGNNPKGGVGVGSKVLLACINGVRSNAVIMGGLPDNQFEDKHDKNDGHNLFFEFNGIKFEINKDGEMTLQFTGSRKVDGDPEDNNDEDAQPTKVNINKDGDLTISTKEDKQLIKIEHKDKKIRIKGDSKVIVECKKINLGEEDPSDALALASKCMTELKKLQKWQKSMKSTFGSHKHQVVGIQTAGSPVAHTQTAPVNTLPPSTPADEPESVDEVKSEVVLAK